MKYKDKLTAIVGAVNTQIDALPENKCRIIYVASQLNENLFSFLCGIICSLPISILFNLISLQIDFLDWRSWVYFIVYVISMIASCIMTSSSIRFTLKQIEISNMDNSIYASERIINCIDEIESLQKEWNMFFVSLLITFSSFVALFLLNNLVMTHG